MCNKYISVFAPGTLWILPDTYLVPVSNGLLGDIVSMYQNMDIKYQNNLQYMGFSNIIINYNMGLWGFINVTERNHWMALNIAFSHIKTSITAYITAQHIADNQFISSYLHITVNNLCGENKYL